MGTKGDNTKQLIIKESIKLFAHKGYLAVTMKDVCEVCGMSRGGLYRHFESTKDIFRAMLDMDIDQNKASVKEAIGNNVPAKHIFDIYLKHETKLTLDKGNGIFFAVHEYAFIESDEREYFKQRLKDSIEILSMIFAHGQSTEEFKKFDIDTLANHTLYFFDSLKTSASIFEPDRKMIEKQIDLIKELII